METVCRQDMCRLYCVGGVDEGIDECDELMRMAEFIQPSDWCDVFACEGVLVL
jgi:hypothetical protein